MNDANEIRHVVMADVVGSSARDGGDVMDQLAEEVAALNAALGDAVLSPLTITLGDEFQGIVASHRAMLDTVFFLEDRRLSGVSRLSLRHSLAVGAIETEVNSDIAHRMLGPALTAARRRLTDKSPGRARVAVALPDDAAATAMEATFRALMRRIDGWSAEEGPYIAAILSDEDVARIAARHGRDETTVYRRRKSGPILDYADLRQALYAQADFLDRSAPWS